ncbi:sialidase family protein [Echinicola shivajiensis]|uniref:sialidase family protein n=1 Tax=Echinicola shivajiensis TaxID=1035916 RepID=UPI001BFC0E43|nr:sialidase family protein [Echinicola shivajiensis]
MINRLILFFISLALIINTGQGQNLKIKQLQIPVLKSKSHSPTLQFSLNTAYDFEIKNVTLSFKESTDLADIESISIFDLGQDSSWQVEKGKLLVQSPLIKAECSIKLSVPLAKDQHFFIVAVKLSDKAPLDHFIAAELKQVLLSNSKTLKLSKKPKVLKQRIGIALRNGGDDGVVRYRIPGLAQTNQKSLLAIYDIRRDNGRDLQGDIDIGVSRSTDGGNTWEPMRIGLDMGEYGGLPQKFNGVSDACILVDKNSDTIYLAGCWMHGVIDEKTGEKITGLNESSSNWNHQWRNNGSLQGFDIDKTSQFIIARSTDDGKTWGEPINITQSIKHADWHLAAPAPGSGITLEDGTLVIPSQGKDENQIPFSNIIFSKDGGKSWMASKPSYTNTTENMVVQLSDGSIMQNMRDNRNRQDKSETNGRAIYTTLDLGNTWKMHPTNHDSLIEPVCMASIYKHEYIDNKGEKKSVLLFSNPNSKYERKSMTIKVSFDDGQSWPEENWLLLDDLSLQGGYSSITSIDNNTIGILYEGSQAQMTFERISLEELGIKDAKKE